MIKRSGLILVFLAVSVVQPLTVVADTADTCSSFSSPPTDMAYNNPFGLPGSTCEYFDWAPPRGLSCRELCEADRIDIGGENWPDVLTRVQAQIAEDTAIESLHRTKLDKALTAARVQLEGTCKAGSPIGPDMFKPQAVVGRAGWHVFGTSSAPLVVIQGNSPVTEAAHILAYLDFVRVILSKANARCVALSVNELSSIVDQWENFHKHGYSQYPWEVWVNGLWRSDTDIRPPVFQVVLLHPTLGMQAAGPVRELMVGNLGPLVETVGTLVYLPSRSYYFGANQIVMLSGDRPPGYGLNLHVGRLVSAGYVWRDGPLPQGKDTFIIGVDIGKALVEHAGDEGLTSLKKIITQ